MPRALTYTSKVLTGGLARTVRGTRRISPRQIDTERLAPRVERAVFGWGIVNPILALPQLYNIFVFRHVAGFSAVTISAALLMAILWTVYGVLGRQTVVWVTSAIWIVLNCATLVGITLFS